VRIDLQLDGADVVALWVRNGFATVMPCMFEDCPQKWSRNSTPVLLY